MFAELGKENISVVEFASMCGGSVTRGSEDGRRVCSVCTDSREIVPGCVFAAIKGARSDGHDYIGTAVKNGAAAVLCEHRVPEYEGLIPQIVTDGTVNAIGRFAGEYRSENRPFTVAVTGSVGKTTAKEMIAQVLSGHKCYFSRGNFNSILGMPMSLISQPEDCGCAVYEMGLEEAGEISRMSRICRPDLAVITNVGSSHLEHIGSREKLLYEKISVKDGLREGGALLLDFVLAEEAGYLLEDKGKYRILTFSVYGEDKADYRVENLIEEGPEQSFDVICPGRVLCGLKINLYGRHNVQAALTACAAADIMGLSDDEIRNGLLSYKPVALRQELREAGGVTLINDCYNASPESMKAACDVLCGGRLKVQGKRLAILGDMLELGTQSERMHYDVGSYFAKSGLDCLICFGKRAAKIGEGARTHMDAASVWIYPDADRPELPAEKAAELLEKGDAVLIKASRGLAAERISARLLEKLGNSQNEDKGEKKS